MGSSIIFAIDVPRNACLQRKQFSSPINDPLQLVFGVGPLLNLKVPYLAIMLKLSKLMAAPLWTGIETGGLLHTKQVSYHWAMAIGEALGRLPLLTGSQCCRWKKFVNLLHSLPPPPTLEGKHVSPSLAHELKKPFICRYFQNAWGFWAVVQQGKDVFCASLLWRVILLG